MTFVISLVVMIFDHISQEQIGTTFFNCAMWAGIWSNIISFFYGREDV